MPRVDILNSEKAEISRNIIKLNYFFFRLVLLEGAADTQTDIENGHIVGRGIVGRAGACCYCL